MVFPPSNGQLKRGKRSGTSEILKFRAIGAVIIYRKLVWNHRIQPRAANAPWPSGPVDAALPEDDDAVAAAKRWTPRATPLPVPP